MCVSKQASTPASKKCRVYKNCRLLNSLAFSCSNVKLVKVFPLRLEASSPAPARLASVFPIHNMMAVKS